MIVDATARSTFRVPEHRLGRPEHTPTASPQAQAEVDVVAADLVALVETADPLEGPPPHEQARAGHRADLAGHMLEVEVQVVRWIKALEKVRSATAEAHKEDARVLDGTLRVHQERADHADVGWTGRPHKSVKPLASGSLHVVV